jgi:hypothetical protein
MEDSEARLAEARQWKLVSLSTDFPEQGAAVGQPTKVEADRQEA